MADEKAPEAPRSPGTQIVPKETAEGLMRDDKIKKFEDIGGGKAAIDPADRMEK